MPYWFGFWGAFVCFCFSVELGREGSEIQNINITITENWGGQSPLGPSGPIPVQAGTPEQGAQGHVQVGFEDLPRRTPHSLGSTFGSALSPIEWKIVSWCSIGTSCIPLCAHCLLSHSWAPLKKKAVSVLFAAFLQVSIQRHEIPLRLPFIQDPELQKSKTLDV